MLKDLRTTNIIKGDEFGNVLHSTELGAHANYGIRDRLLETSLGGVNFNVYVYRMGDRYHADRSNEFRYANYENEPKAE